VTTANDLLRRFETVLRAQKLSKLTIDAYVSVVEKFLTNVQTLDPESIMNWAQTIADYHKPSTVNLYYSAMRRFLEEISPQTLLILKDKLRVKGRSNIVPRALSEQQIMKLWHLATRYFERDHRLVLIVGLAGYAGLRVSELISLKVCNIRLDEDCITVNGKGRKTRVVPLPSKLKPYIAQIISQKHESDFLIENKKNGQRLSVHGIAYLLKKLASKAGIRQISPHVLRHTAATILLRKGVNLRIVQEFLGHASLATTERYLKVTVKDMKESLWKVGY